MYLGLCMKTDMAHHIEQIIPMLDDTINNSTPRSNRNEEVWD
jgi:predicted NACHT family NTPase